MAGLWWVIVEEHQTAKDSPVLWKELMDGGGAVPNSTLEKYVKDEELRLCR